ncbi:hypothetical protein K502DRAFT_361714 [Neoconidiobolus thromboides FSU 785]|nr:hypothetical protein K502DRAFT_361714 [Neoconidiobolus thromboides FSU 785]
MSIEKVEQDPKNLEVNPSVVKNEEVDQEFNNEEASIDILQLTVILPHEPHKIKVRVALTDNTTDLRQNISENPFTYYFSCFYMEHNGKRLEDYQEISTIEGLKENPEIYLKQDTYTDREARLHIMRLKELLLCYQKSGAKLGYDENATCFQSIVPGSQKKKSKKKESKESKAPTTLTAHAFVDYDFEHPYISLDTHLPVCPPPTAPKCLKLFDFSGWCPVPPTRKLKGDFFYLAITTLEGKTYEITSNTEGFYVNNSTTEHFDPTPKAPAHSNQAHSLVHLLQKLSPQFRSGLSKIQQILLSSEIMQAIPANTQNIIYPWLVTPQSHTYDISRTTEPYLSKGTEAAEGLRDWNEEIQVLTELPYNSLQEKSLRDRALSKTYSDFYESAIQAIVLVSEGNLMPLNPTDGPEGYMWALNNLFITRPYDSTEQFDSYGGDEAAYVATSKDIQGVKILNSLGLKDLYVFGSVIIDYRGERYIVQAIIPGLFRMHEMIRYGATGSEKGIITDEKFHELASQVSEKLHLAPHTVLENDQEIELNLSVDTKGILGTEGRHYLVDLHRLFPVDISFQETATKEKDIFNEYPHSLTLLRPELLARFWEHKFSIYKKEKLDEIVVKKNEKGEVDQAELKETFEERLQREEELRKEYKLNFNPDVFTDLPIAREGKFAEKVKADEEVVREASNYILNVEISSLITDISDSLILSDSNALTKYLHSKGINIRYIGKICTMLGESENARCKVAKQLFIIEMFVRAIKHVFRKALSEVPLTLVGDCISTFLNLLFSPVQPEPSKQKKINGEDYLYQKLEQKSLLETILNIISTRFRYKATTEQFHDISKRTLLREICLVMGIQLNARDFTLNGQPKQTPVTNGASSPTEPIFKESDVVAVVPKLKHTLIPPTYPEDILEGGRNIFNDGHRPLGLEHMTESINFFEQIFGTIHPDTAHCYANIASVHSIMDNTAQAEEYQKKSLIICERSLGIDHPETIQSYIQYGFFLLSFGRADEGLKYIRFALDRWYTIYDIPNINMAFIDFNLGGIFQKYKQLDLATSFYQRALKVLEAIVGTEDFQFARCQHALASIYAEKGDFKTAIALEKATNEIFTKVLGADKNLTLRSTQALQEYTFHAVKSARQEKLEKTPEYRQLVQKQKALLKQEEERLKESKEKEEGGSKGHLPVDYLVKYIDGSGKNKNKNLKKKKSKTPPVTAN